MSDLCPCWKGNEYGCEEHGPLAHTGGTFCVKPKRHPRSDRFHELLKMAAETHDRKQADYGSDVDPFANISASADLGIEPWIGALLRMNDKVTRLKHMAQGAELQNESALDSLMDIAVYALISYVLLEEEDAEVEDDPTWWWNGEDWLQVLPEGGAVLLFFGETPILFEAEPEFKKGDWVRVNCILTDDPSYERFIGFVFNVKGVWDSEFIVVDDPTSDGDLYFYPGEIERVNDDREQ